ncbi:AAAP amino acid permease [Lanmaoa asiatica]|nr:AAAP amino acid permease [Lanmaoa asiatica]
MPRTINFLGSVALLVSNMTGPSLVVIPLLFQQAGWLTPLLTFAAIALLSGAAALFLVEAMSSIEGNEGFQASIEFTTIAHLFLGKRWHVVVQGLLYLAIQTLVIASMLESFQIMDAFLISVAHKTCAVSFTDGWVCGTSHFSMDDTSSMYTVNQIPPNGSSAFSGYILGSFGTLITLSLILPLSLIRLVDNIIFQVASFIVLLITTIVWVVIFALSGLNANAIPVVGYNQSSVVGFVLSNFSFVTMIPAWVNNTHPSVNIRHAVWISVLISCLIYIPVGWMGGSAFVIPNNATLLQVFGTDTGRGALNVVAQVSSYVFPLAVLITSIPVFTIVVRYNLLRGNLCSNKMAIFWSAIVPWLITIPFQTNGGLATILNWASLIFTSPSNLLVPFILFIVSKRHMASAVLDAKVSPEMHPVSEVGAPLSPVKPTTTSGQTVTPVENIPVVIITDSTDVDPNSTGEKTKESGEVVTSAVEATPMSIRNRVSSPSVYRYYGQEVLSEGGGSPASADGTNHPVLLLDTTGKAAAEAHNQRRPSLSISLSRSHSILHSSNTGMDEFLLMSPPSPELRPHSVRTVLSAHSPRSSMSTELGSSPGLRSPDAIFPGVPSTPDERHLSAGSDTPRDAAVRLSISIPTTDVEEPLTTFKAFPSLSATSLIRSTRISAVGCLLSAALVLTALVYDIVQSVGGGSSG